MLRIETVFAGLGMDMIRSSRPRSNALRSEAAASFRQLTYRQARARLNIRRSTQTDTQRFSLPFDYHLRKITAAPISACAPADGTRRRCW